MATLYTIQQGDHASRIADQFGFADFKTIWDDPANADLRQLRENPHVLNPGDQLTIPDKEQKIASAPTTKLTQFVIPTPSLILRLQFTDHFENPFSNEPCDLQLDGAKSKTQTDGQGVIEKPIKRSAKAATLDLLEVEVPVKIGNLDTADLPSGQCARLNNLGYFAGDPGVDDLRFRSAVEEFQCDNNLPVTGVCDDQTQSMLKQIHGC